MKTTTIRMLGRGLTALCLMLWSYSGFTQNISIAFEVKNMVQTSPYEFDYEVWATATGLDPVALRGYSWGLNTAIGLNESSYLAQSFISRDASLASLPPVNTNPAASVTPSPAFPNALSAAHLRGTTVNAASGNEVALTIGVPVRLATMRIRRVTTANGTIGNPWTGTNINPFTNLGGTLTAIQVVTGPGKTQCVATLLDVTTFISYAVNGTANNAAAGTLQTLGATMTPDPNGPSAFKLNVPAGCTTPVTMPTTVASACGSYTWAANGTTYTTTGMYSHTVSPGAPACDTIYNLDLTITPNSTNTTTATACGSYTWAANSTTYTASGMYTGPTNGCVTEMLSLTITPNSTNTTTASACDSYTWNGTTYTASGMYTGATVNCVTEMLSLTITPSSTNTTTASACDSYAWNGNTYTASGMYTGATANCVTEMLNLTITPSSTTTTTASACGSYSWNGNTYTATGMYTGATVACVTEMLDLTITPNSTNTTTASACDSYTWNGNTYTASGTYTGATTNCVTEELVLTISSSTNTTVTASACDTYTWATNGATYTASGMYTVTNACSTTTLDLTITPSSTTTTTASACGSYTWNGNTYTASGMYTGATVACVTEMLDLTITPNSTTTTTASACDSYSWNGNTYTASGMYAGATVACVTEMLNLTITPSSTNTTTAAACDSYTWNGNTYTASGMYTGATVACVTEMLNLTITPSSTTTTTASACGSYTWNGNTYTASGMYTGATVACVTEMLDLTIVPNSTNTTPATACGSYTWNGATYTASGMYTGPTTACVTEMLNLTINNGVTNTTTATAAGSYTWVVNGVTYLASGSYTSTSLNANGCVNTEVLNLTITSAACPYTITLTENQPISCFGNNDGAVDVSVLPAGTYSYAIDGGAFGAPTTANGYFAGLTPGVHTIAVNDGTCTSTATITYVEPDPLNMTFYTDSMLSCNGGDGAVSVCISGGTANLQPYLTWWYAGPVTINWPAPGFTLNDLLTDNFATSLTNLPAGQYTVKTEDDRGCFYEETYTILQAAPVTVAPVYPAITCNGGTTVVTPVGTGGVMYLPTNSTTSAPCPAPIPATVSTLVYTVNGAPVAASYGAGTYTLTATDFKGCSASTVFTITEPAISGGSMSATACDSYTWSANGATYTMSGSYTSTSLNSAGCPSTDTLNLTINNSTSNTTSASWCDQYTWALSGMTYTATGIYSVTSTNAAGCVHTEYLNLTLGQTQVNVICCVTACGSYSWTTANGTIQTITSSGTYYTIGQQGVNGCAIVNVLCITIGQNTSSSLTATACNSYTWAANSMTYTATGAYTATSLNAAGCTHTTTLNLTILGGTTTTDNQTACDSYAWMGATYTTSGTYTHTVLNASGCVDTHILNLTIVNTVNTTSTAVACDSYMWAANGMTYTASGTYTHTTQNGPCVNTATLNLTITNTVNTTSTVDACDSYMWAANGMTYTASGTYTYTTQNGPCVNTATLNLTITNTVNTTSTADACDSYMWAANGMTYTASGTYTHTTQNGPCVNTATLNLTITNTVNTTTSMTACDSYTWTANGMTYTASGTYTHTTQNGPCVNTATLNLTVNYSATSNSSATACDSYFWAQNSTTYTTSGVYTATGLTAAGCLDTHVLTLTVNYSSTTSSSMTACDSYTWAANGVTYTTSGAYTNTTLNASGCVNTATLNLTVNYSSTTSMSATACDMYTWNGMTYTTSGTYTHTSLNASGCVNTATLNLTVNYSTNNGGTTTTQCNSYLWNGTTYTASGTYTFTSLNASGCVNTATLNLTINYGSSSTTTVAACNSYTWTNGTTYTASGTYTYTTQNSVGCDSALTLILTMTNGVNISAKAMLKGAFDPATGLMKDSLRRVTHYENVIPGSINYPCTYGVPQVGAPVNVIPTTRQNFAQYFSSCDGDTTIGAAVLAVMNNAAYSDNNSIVDWAFVEVRDGANFNNVVGGKYGLIQRDGDIVSATDGVSPLYFPCVCPGNYYIVVRHRNHLGVMTANTVALSNVGVASVDFTDSNPAAAWVKPGVTNTPRKVINGVAVLWGGDANSNKNSKYNGLANDKEQILADIASILCSPLVPPGSNNIFYQAYKNSDLNMDGKVKYNNADNDKNWLLDCVLGSASPSTPNTIISQHTP